MKRAFLPIIPVILIIAVLTSCDRALGPDSSFVDSSNWQIGYNSSKKEFRVFDDSMKNYYIVTCSALPSSTGQKLEATVTWSSGSSTQTTKGKFEVAKAQGDTFWLWCGDKKNPTKPNGPAADVDEFEMVVLESGADDYEDADEEWIVYTDYQDLAAVKKALEDEGVQVKGSELIMVPTTYTQVEPKDAAKVMRLIDKLEELEDLQNVYHTMEMTDEIVAALED